MDKQNACLKDFVEPDSYWRMEQFLPIKRVYFFTNEPSEREACLMYSVPVDMSKRHRNKDILSLSTKLDLAITKDGLIPYNHNVPEQIVDNIQCQPFPEELKNNECYSRYTYSDEHN